MTNAEVVSGSEPEGDPAPIEVFDFGDFKLPEGMKPRDFMRQYAADRIRDLEARREIDGHRFLRGWKRELEYHKRVFAFVCWFEMDLLEREERERQEERRRSRGDGERADKDHREGSRRRRG